MATIAVGDIHGNLQCLRDLLHKLEPELTTRDVVVFLVDYIDRGRDSRGCVDAILSFRDTAVATVVTLRGNHEDWLLRTAGEYSRHSWLIGMDAFETIRSYSPEAEAAIRAAIGEAGPQLFLGNRTLPYGVFFDAMLVAHRAFFETLAPYFQGPDCICTHAGLNPHVKRLADQSLQPIIWGHDAFPAPYDGEVPVVYGHWNNGVIDARGWPGPHIVGNTIGIDTIAHGVLTAIRQPERYIFQSDRFAATL